ncbi:MAG: tRNA (adenosine(37)-N6)-dimethylallyltransferase MiaA [Acidobacteriota bacterium]
MSSDTLIIIVGPTASGKSRLALFLAQRLNAEIISVDSIQVYRRLNIGTAKPDINVLKQIPHHMIDVAEPGDDFSLGHFVRSAERIIQEIWKRRKLPLLVGGTGLYLRGLLKGIFEAPARDEEIRKSLRMLAEEKGIEHLHSLLHEVDPASARRISGHDSQRIIRALELHRKTKKTMSELIQEKSFGQDRYASVKVGVNTKRARLYRNIEERVEEFYKNGLVEEVRSLLESGVDPECKAFNAVGYRETVSYLRGEIDRDKMIALVKRNTKRFAKRQMTWFRKEENIQWFFYENDVSETSAEILDFIKGKLRNKYLQNQKV